jgi:transglutaminase superfamily protein
LAIIGRRSFRAVWWGCNLLLIAAMASLVYTGGWEISLRRYLRGFSDAIVPVTATPAQKTEAILGWMRSGPPRPVAADPSILSPRDPEVTLNFQQLLVVCGSATNAFLNLSESAGLKARRLLLLGPDRQTKHVVAEVQLDDRWIVVDPAYRLMMRDAQGRFVTRKDLQDPLLYAQATSRVPNYPPEYTYERIAHVRMARLPLIGFGLRRVFDAIYPGWEESLDWNLLLERKSFFILAFSAAAAVCLLVLRAILGWYADHRLRIPRFHFFEHARRAVIAFFSTPEIK